MNMLRVSSDPSDSSMNGEAIDVTLKHEDGPDVELRVRDPTVSVHGAVGKELQEDPGLLKVEFGCGPVEWGESFVDVSIQDRAKLSVLKNVEAARALEEVQQLGPASCTSTEISLRNNRSVIRLPKGTRVPV